MWTLLTHNSTAPVTVQGSSLQRPHIMKFNYSALAEQLHAIVSRSEQCQQEVVYNCRKSRLFNTKGECYFASSIKYSLSYSIYEPPSDHRLILVLLSVNRNSQACQWEQICGGQPNKCWDSAEQPGCQSHPWPHVDCDPQICSLPTDIGDLFSIVGFQTKNCPKELWVSCQVLVRLSRISSLSNRYICWDA